MDEKTLHARILGGYAVLPAPGKVSIIPSRELPKAGGYFFTSDLERERRWA